jgi:taurine transport system substrate-binding protein
MTRPTSRVIPRWLATAALLLTAGLSSAQAKEVTVAYQDMVVPWRYAQLSGEVEKATGYKINFRKFAGGGDVIRAMASGQVQLGEVGSAPVAAALSQGLPVELVWVLDDIANAEAMVARNGSGVSGVADLKGKRIGVPFTSTTHFHTLVALQAAQVNPAQVKILNMRPPEIAAAWERGDIDATFVWDPVLSKVKASGRQIISSGEISQQTGKATFDGIIVNKSWAAANADFMRNFLGVIARADASYMANQAQWQVGSSMVKAVADVTGAVEADVPKAMALYRFVPPSEQVSVKWLGGGTQGGAAASLAATAAFLQSQGSIAKVLPDYSVGINPSYAAQIQP